MYLFTSLQAYCPPQTTPLTYVFLQVDVQLFSSQDSNGNSGRKLGAFSLNFSYLVGLQTLFEEVVNSGFTKVIEGIRFVFNKKRDVNKYYPPFSQPQIHLCCSNNGMITDHSQIIATVCPCSLCHPIQFDC